MPVTTREIDLDASEILPPCPESVAMVPLMSSSMMTLTLFKEMLEHGHDMMSAAERVAVLERGADVGDKNAEMLLV